MRSDVYDEEYVSQNPVVEEFCTKAQMSEHSVNTDRFEVASSGMSHSEGGWPALVAESLRRRSQRAAGRQ